MSKPNPVPEHLLEYRKVLVAADQKGQEEFDKAVLSLSGGGLGVSLVFLKDVIGSDPVAIPMVLMGAWVCWALSTLSVLISYHLSILTLRRGIEQIDQGDAYSGPLGGAFAIWTERLNLAGAGLFFVGVLMITVFACVNLSSKEFSNGNKTSITSVTSASTSASAASAASSGTARQPRSGRGDGVGSSVPAAPAPVEAVVKPQMLETTKTP